MDQIKIGKFIAEMRKEQNLTQIDLADQLGISNKTISKWECGNGMPDYAVMESLCDTLKINVNELLSGERLPSKDYNKKAEENMMSLIQESNEKRMWIRKDFVKSILGMIILWLTVICMILTCGGFSAIANFIDIPSVLYVLLPSFIVLATSGLWNSFWRAFRYVWGEKALYDIAQVRKSILALKTAMRVFVLCGLIMSCMSVVVILRQLSNPETLGPLMALTALSSFYGLLFSLCLIPVKTNLEKRLLEE